MSTNEYHIASFIAQVMPKYVKHIVALIEKNPQMEVHAIEDSGKIIFTAEDTSQALISEHADAIKQHPYVLTLSPVYHQFINENDLSQAGEI